MENDNQDKILDLSKFTESDKENNDTKEEDVQKSEHRLEFEERIKRMEKTFKQTVGATHELPELPKSSKFKTSQNDTNKNTEQENNIEEKKIEDKNIDKPEPKIINFQGTFSNIKSTQKEFKFPKGFLWGTSTSAYQVEGGIKCDWSEWEVSEVRSKKLEVRKFKRQDFVCDKASDSYNRWEEDLDLAVDLNTNVIRLGIEWARVQPEKNSWDVSALDHYRKVLEGAQKRRLKTVVTLWHWTNPLWLRDEKGWTNKNVVEYFSEYTKMIVEEFGGLVDFWITLNEPMVPVVNGYINGKFPPNKKLAFLKTRKVFKNLYKAHNAAYAIIHEYFPKAQVSITNLTNCFEPARKWLLPEAILAKLAAHYSNHKFLGKIKKHIDFIGMDYYFHDRIVMYPPFKKNKNKHTTDMDWEIYPEGIYHVLKELNRYKKPIIVMENGLADKDDKYREAFIKEHLYWTWKAIKEGVNVKGYFYWSLLDNFEWDKGFWPKFGLFEVDRETFARSKRGSADFYAGICRENKVNF